MTSLPAAETAKKSLLSAKNRRRPSYLRLFCAVAKMMERLVFDEILKIMHFRVIT